MNKRWRDKCNKQPNVPFFPVVHILFLTDSLGQDALNCHLQADTPLKASRDTERKRDDPPYLVMIFKVKNGGRGYFIKVYFPWVGVGNIP